MGKRASDRAMCGDPNLAVDSRGTFYVAFNRLGCAPGEPEPPLARWLQRRP